MILSVLSFYLQPCYSWGTRDVAPVDEVDSGPSLTAPYTATYFIALFFFVWYMVILFIAYTGFFEILWKFSTVKRLPVVSDEELESVTILRPLKGIDTEMEQCLESSFSQKYPHDRLEIIFCVESSTDQSIPIVEKLIAKYPHVDAKLLIGDKSDHIDHFGPNPKINNLAKGYVSAKNDIIWVLDSNVWTSSGTLMRSVVSLLNSEDNGRTTSRPIKLVHHTPLALSLASGAGNKNFGSKLDEMFLLTSHPKFYVSFNRLSVAPCVNGKSNIYRRSELDASVRNLATTGKSFTREASEYAEKGFGIRFFARFIGEDNMIGISLWEMGGRTGMTGDCVIQPLNGSNSLNDYVLRRVRWLRVRKYMVLAATLLEPTTESLLSGVFGTFAISNLFGDGTFMWSWYFFHLTVWIITDFIQYHVLINFAPSDLANNDIDVTMPWWMNTDAFALKHIANVRYFFNWWKYWILRELLALPIWIIAMLGHEIDWRNKPFKIKSDLTAEEL